MNKLLSRAGIGIALGLAALPALAQNTQPPALVQPPAPDGDGTRMQARIAAKLQLTDAQKAGCRAVLDKHRDALAQKGRAAFEAHRAFREAFDKPETTPDALRALHRAWADQAFEQQLERRAQRQELHALLTPEQREKAARMEGRMEGMRAARRGGWEGAAMGHRGHWGPGQPAASAPQAVPAP